MNNMTTQRCAPGARFDADVAIVGAGPTGTLLAILLARQGHQVTLVERWPQPYSRPRAVTFDHEIARILSVLGIDADNDPAIDHHDALYYWRNAAGEDLQIVDWQSTSASGWRVRYWFYQPDLEKRLLGLATGMENIRLIRGWEAHTLHQDENGILLSGQAAANAATESVRARYVVGADGANSFVRQALDLPLVDQGFFYDWLILDMKPHQPRQMDPIHWQLCDPQRPTTIVPGGPGRLRWEFMALPGESREELAREDNAWQLLRPWNVTAQNATLERSAVYRFQACLADNWRRGRGMIAGDAAHLMPPFAGEGMCAGLRDAAALSWRLDAILRGVMDERILDSYTSERREHARHYIEFSMYLGRIICITDPQQATLRDQQMQAELRATGGTPLPTDQAALGPGAWCSDAPHAGEIAHQGRVRRDDREDRFDEIAGRGWMVIGYGVCPRQALAEHQLTALARLNAHFVVLGPPGSECDIEDSDGVYGAWLAASETRYLVVRPDFYVATSARTAGHFRQQIACWLAQLPLTHAQSPLAVTH
ncbi:bifunctional 3-(3-hydroxy-phenyl)propionate/3-hydroxycinnamic acid hydroxylase [Shimwellia blattae]|uniref:Putative 3-(3-hydroxy-phenyl)propionate hydroxylase n=1 Tax=Shimwellia blattae (strain ATCC 29907 / DSM 4481 / JCM 1650 / NBRC 105725 / CDC 9005-74) TaxID=630626 RepID=I2B6U0_SHIBC|nr:bifunctional 3-(3-hydroxy-phenyl)propionate/3-hydroxycinnamic acid hydroxylase [Shimwellia blattae]AFJ46244.1 putative 3-(3-hydroxy-phenyl)propionate hydroxylase [Shimwellia blattae DSM 4481 = NBRC 105725]GAB81120.1 putative monooxygenase [Shimwellia blattae DSM 4481 = NBRC 105725]VDY63709.1 3-(3-hydroxy-phenyl)propionate/3-hydroxycinnamic acid hydroxylase [Shimwellia blattae]VEC21852.1 3-(3-hydroxy-phenyl)propionate/3-hydroxycinnamic acid hydroxylase [Shimwellia blattae]